MYDCRAIPCLHQSLLRGDTQVLVVKVILSSLVQPTAFTID